ncbi:MAG: hypothetical protein WB628_14350, partial [Candidatus Sulfotelmatobacter sp.]
AVGASGKQQIPRSFSPLCGYERTRNDNSSWSGFFLPWAFLFSLRVRMWKSLKIFGGMTWTSIDAGDLLD